MTSEKVRGSAIDLFRRESASTLVCGNCAVEKFYHVQHFLVRAVNRSARAKL
jgi:hypothetical protein